MNGRSVKVEESRLWPTSVLQVLSISTVLRRCRPRRDSLDATQGLLLAREVVQQRVFVEPGHVPRSENVVIGRDDGCGAGTADKAKRVGNDRAGAIDGNG
jgi:hypothetical protein